MLKPYIYALACIGLCCLPVYAQEGRDRQNLAGKWEARFQGHVFLTINLQAGDKISGTVSTGNITVNDQGDLTKAEPSESGESSTILKPQFDGETLSFEIADGDDEVLKIELHITGVGRGELRFKNPPSPIKPISVKRA